MTDCGCADSCEAGWDRFTPATRELMVFTKSPKRYFDLDAVREPYSETTIRQSQKPSVRAGINNGPKANDGDPTENLRLRTWALTKGGVPPLDWWEFPTPKPYNPEHRGEPMTATFYVGDALEVMAKLPEKSVDLVLSSPPFLALRSYLPADHPDKSKEGGSQATPGEYIDWLVDVAEACARVLAPHGSLCFELGDTYAGSGGAGGDYASGGIRQGQPMFRQGSPTSQGHIPRQTEYGANMLSNSGGTGWPLPKSLSLIPELFRLTLVYGVNPLTGRQTDRWRLRNVIRWVRPNPPVGALGDKFRPATSELMVFCKSAKRYFDLDAVREPHQNDRNLKPTQVTTNHGGNKDGRKDFGEQFYNAGNPAGAPPLDWWEISLPDLEAGEKVWWCVYGVDTKACQDNRHPYTGTRCGWRLLIPIPDSPMSATPPLNVSLLGEEPTPYGPGEKPKSHARTAKGVESAPRSEKSANRGGNWASLPELHETQGAPPLDWWNIPPGGYEGAHYAVFPPELCVRPIKAMCPEFVCRTCGEPRRRIVGEAEYISDKRGEIIEKRRFLPGERQAQGAIGVDTGAHRIAPTLGFSDCGHNNWRPGLVLDPFAGSGTTLAVATGHGREAIGIDLDSRNYELALQRVGPMFLERGEVPV